MRRSRQSGRSGFSLGARLLDRGGARRFGKGSKTLFVHLVPEGSDCFFFLILTRGRDLWPAAGSAAVSSGPRQKQRRGLRPGRPEEVRGVRPSGRGRAEVHRSPGRGGGKGEAGRTPPKRRDGGPVACTHRLVAACLSCARARPAPEAEVEGRAKGRGRGVAERASATAGEGPGGEGPGGEGGGRGEAERRLRVVDHWWSVRS